MADLKTDYVDDILNTAVNTNRKYQMIDNGDGTVSFVDVTDYTQQGDGYGATQINEQNEAINELKSDLSTDIANISESITNISSSITALDTNKMDKNAIISTDLSMSIQPDKVDPRVELDCSLPSSDSYNPTISMDFHNAQGDLNDQLLIKYDGTNFILIGKKAGVTKTATIPAS